MANSKNLIKSLVEIIRGDFLINSYVKSRCYAKSPLKPDSVTPLVGVWFDDDATIGGLPAGNGICEIGVWNNIDNAKCLEVILDIKDRVKILVNQKPDVINSLGYITKVRTFDLVSGSISDEHIGSLKMWYLPLFFSCIIGDE